MLRILAIAAAVFFAGAALADEAAIRKGLQSSSDEVGLVRREGMELVVLAGRLCEGGAKRSNTNEQHNNERACKQTDQNVCS